MPLSAIDGVETCKADGLLEEDAASPIVLVWPSALEPAEDVGELGWHTTAVVELVVIVPTSDRMARRRAFALAQKVAIACEGATWDLTVAPASVPDVRREALSDFGPGFEEWHVELAQSVIWAEAQPPDGAPITTVKIGRAPNIGLGHEDDYRQVVPEEDEAP